VLAFSDEAPSRRDKTDNPAIAACAHCLTPN